MYVVTLNGKFIIIGPLWKMKLSSDLQKARTFCSKRAAKNSVNRHAGIRGHYDKPEFINNIEVHEVKLGLI